MARSGPCLILLAVLALSGCTSWRAEEPLAGSSPPPLPLEVADAGKTVDLSYRYSGDDERWQTERCRRLVLGVYERSGYLVHEVPWAAQPGAAARVRVEVTNDSSRGWLYLAQFTFCALPGYGRFTTTFRSEARSAGSDVVFGGQTTAKSFVWLPLFWLSFTAKPIFALEAEGLEELVGRSIVELRERRILPSP